MPASHPSAAYETKTIVVAFIYSKVSIRYRLGAKVYVDAGDIMVRMVSAFKDHTVQWG